MDNGCGIEMMELVYLFLSERGPIRRRQLKKFDGLFNSIQDFAGERAKIINNCEEILTDSLMNQSKDESDEQGKLARFFGAIKLFVRRRFGGKRVRLNVITEKIDMCSSYFDDIEKRQLLWMLVSLIYYYKEKYTEGKQKIIRHVIDRFNIDQAIFYEMKDTAETMTAINKQRGWILRQKKWGQLKKFRILPIAGILGYLFLPYKIITIFDKLLLLIIVVCGTMLYIRYFRKEAALRKLAHENEQLWAVHLDELEKNWEELDKSISDLVALG